MAGRYLLPLFRLPGQAFWGRPVFSAHAPSGQVNAHGVVDEAIEDGVGVGRIADQLVPVVDGSLAGDDGGLSAVTVFQDL